MIQFKNTAAAVLGAAALVSAGIAHAQTNEQFVPMNG